MVKFIGPLKDVNTIGEVCYTIKKGLPGVSVPSVNMDMILYTSVPGMLDVEYTRFAECKYYSFQSIITK